MATTTKLAGEVAGDAEATGWWSRPSHRLAVATLATALPLTALGWFTGVSRMLDWLGGGLLVVLFWPLLVIAAGLALILILVLLAAMTESHSDAAEGAGLVIVGGGSWGVRYYKWLARVRHPVFWGVGLGVGLAFASLWVLTATIIRPREQRTLALLGDAQELLAVHFDQHQDLPSPSQDHLAFALAGAEQPAVTLRDAWGRPFQYDLVHDDGAVRYRLRSLGFDGVRSGDDLCAAASLGERERAPTPLTARSVARQVAQKTYAWWKKRRAAKRGEAVPEGDGGESASDASDPGQLHLLPEVRQRPGRC